MRRCSVCFGEAETTQDATDFGLDGVAAASLEGLLQLGVARDEIVQVGAWGGHLGLQCAHRLLHRQQVVDCREHLVVQRAAWLDAGVLRQVADDEARWQLRATAVGVFEAGDDFEQRRLAGAVGRHQGGTLGGLERQRHVVEDALAAVVFPEVFDAQHGRDMKKPRHTNGGVSDAAPHLVRPHLEPAQYGDRDRLCAAVIVGTAFSWRSAGGGVESGTLLPFLTRRGFGAITFGRVVTSAVPLTPAY